MASVDPPKSVAGSPTWEIANLYPQQGSWTVTEYLALNTNHLVEYSAGVLEFVPMPTEQHQLIVAYLYETFKAFVVAGQLGKVLFSPLRIKLWEGKFREPDIVFMHQKNAERRGERFWNGADLVMEVVSEDDPDRDLIEKRAEYAKAGIEEYWIVDPRASTIAVLSLNSATREYAESVLAKMGGSAKSELLPGFSIMVDSAFSQT